MYRKTIGLLLLTILVVWQSLPAQVSQRPKIGLVLSGGGAKGLAHIGALKVLNEAGIYPDYITGTSMGSIVGGLYAIGYSVEELEDLALKLNWDHYFTNQLGREYLPIEERGTGDYYQLSLEMVDGKIQLPKGLISGRKINLLLSRMTARSHGVTSFDEFPIPFRCVATDFETGDAAVLAKGNLGDAIRASMSIPSVFEPFEIDGRPLIDGMSVRNLPVEDVRDMGADIVIAVDVGAPLYTKEDISSLAIVMEQTNSYRIVESNEWQANFADIIIRPDMTDLGATSFHLADTLIVRGEKATRDSLAQVLAVLGGEKGVPPTKVLEQVEIVSLTGITVEGLEERRAGVVKKLLQFKIGEEYTIEEIESRFQKLLGSRFVKDARYRLIPEGLDYHMLILATPQSGAFVKVGMNYDSDLKAGLLLNATFRNKLINGSRFSLDLKVSEFPSLKARYMLYTATRPNIGLRLDGRAHFYPGFFYEEGQFVEEFELAHYEGRVDIFSALNNRWLLALGVGLDRYSQSGRFFSAEGDESLRLDQASLYGSIIRDTYDRLWFPHEGSQLSLTGKLSYAARLRRIGSNGTTELNTRSSLLRFQYRKLIPLSKRWALVWFNDGGIIEADENNLLSLFFLGRRLPGEWTHVAFYGLDLMEQPARLYGLSGLKIRFEPALAYFVSALFNAGYYKSPNFTFINGEDTRFIPQSKDYLYGAGIELGVYTRLGPAWLSTEYNFNAELFNFALHMGYFF